MAPAAPRQNTSDDTTEPAAPSGGHVVLTDGFVYRTGEKREEVKRAMLGQVIYDVDNKFNDVAKMIRKHQLAVHDGKPKVRTNAAMLARHDSLDPDDPSKVPTVEMFAVAPAQAREIDPEAARVAEEAVTP